MMNGRKNWVRGAAWILSIILFLQAMPLGLAEDWSGFTGDVSGVLESSDRYTVRFILDGEAVDTLFVPAGTPIGALPDAPERQFYAFRGWFDGDDAVDASYVPAADTALTGRYALLSAVQTLTGETELGTAAYFDQQGENLPGGASATVQTFEDEMILEKVETDGGKRILGQFRFGVSDPYWSGEDQVRVAFSFRKPIDLKDGEALQLLDRDGKALEGARFTIQEGQLTGFDFTASLQDRFSLIGCYDEEEEKAVLYPAVTASGLANDISVLVDAPEGALPEGAVFQVSAVDSEAYRAAAEALLGEEAGRIKAIDLTFVGEDGTEYQPLKPVNVKMSVMGMGDAKTLSVIHFGADGAAEVVYSGQPDAITRNDIGGKTLQIAKSFMDGGSGKDADNTVRTFSFQATGFSVYAVVEGVEPESRMTVNFYGKDTTTPLATMFIKNGDDLAQATKILYDPGAGTMAEGETFRGWVIGEIAHAGTTAAIPAYTVATATDGTLKTIEDIRVWAAAFDENDASNCIREGDVVNIRAAIYKIYVVTYLDSKDIAQSADSILIMPDDTSAYYEYTISQSYIPPKDTVRFEGWEPTAETVNNITAATQQTDNLYQKDDVINITGNVDFRVVESEGHWIVFHENGKGADYKAPEFVVRGDNTVDPGTMERKGYTFGGWYTEVTGEPDSRGYTQVVESSRFTFGSDLDNFGDGKLHLYAKWTPVTTAPYTVIFWGQRLDDNGKVINGSYEVLGSFVNNNGTVGQNIPYTSVNNGDEDYAYCSSGGTANFGRNGNLNNNEDPGIDGHYRGFNLTAASQGQQVTITPEGDAVLNLYYDRIEYNFKFYLYRDGTQNNRYDYANNSGTGSDLDGLVTWHSNQTAHPSVTGYTIQTETVGGRTYHYFTITAHYGENIEDVWPTYDKITGANGRVAVSFVMMVGTKLKPSATNQGSGTVKGVISVLNWNILGATNNANGNYVVIRFPDSYYNWRYHIWLEAIDADHVPAGKTTHTHDGKLYYEETVMQVRSSNTTDANQNEPKYTGFDYVTRLGQNNNGTTWQDGHWTTTENGGTLYHLNYIYNRQQFTITYFDGNYVDGDGKTIQNRSSSQELHHSDPIPQGKEIGEEYTGYVPDAVEAGYVFEGWYLDAGCTVPYPWTVMPVGGIIVYAKWQQIQYRVFLHSCVPEDEEFTWGSDTQKMNFRVDYGGTVSLPTGRDREGWEFLNWYTTPTYTPSSLFTSDYALTESNVTGTYNKETDFTDPMNKWGNISGGNPTNSDVGRDWITKKLDLYAKWHQVLEGADGINIVYDPILASAGNAAPTGHNPPTDDTYYIDTAQATAQAGSTADDTQNYQFECWVVQRWDGTAYVDTDVEVYPGDTFEVLKASAKEEDYTDPNNPKITKRYTVQLRAKYKPLEDPTPTHIWWYNNFDAMQVVTWNTIPGKTGTYERMAINEGVDIKPANTFTHPQGYTFVGWARVPNNVSGTANGGTAQVLPYATVLQYLYLKYEDGVFKLNDSESEYDGYTVSLVAADEVTPYHDLYAVWEPFTQVPVEKIWQPGNFAAYQTDSVTVELLRNGQSFSPAKTMDLSESNNWKYTFDNLPTRDDDNHLITYTIAETVPAGWKETYDPAAGVTATTDGQPTQTLKVTNQPKNGKITLFKHIAGPTEDFSSVFTGLQFTLKGPKQSDGSYKNTYTFLFSDFNNSGTTFSGQYTFLDTAHELAFVEPGEYIYYEDNADLLTPWGYSVDQTVAGTTGATNPVTFTLGEGGDEQPAITNTYTRDRGNLVVNKTVAGDHESGAWPYKVKIKNSENWWLKQDLTLTSNENEAYEFEIPRTGETLNGTLTLANIPTGTYTVIEQGTEEGGAAQITNYTLEATYSPANAQGVVTKNNTNDPATVTVTNTYTIQVVDLTLTKKVTGNLGDVGKDFSFTVTADGNPVSTENGDQTFTLHHNQSVTLKDVPIGAQLVITETSAEKYTASATLDGSATGVTVSNPTGTDDGTRTVTLTVPEPLASGNHEIVITNDQRMAPPPTGIHMDRGAYMALLCLALVLGAALTADAWKEKLRNRE